MPIALQWEGDSLPYHVDTVETAHCQYDFIAQAQQRLDSTSATLMSLTHATISHIANGGAMAVYKLTAHYSLTPPQHLVCKIPHQRQLVYSSGNERDTTIETTHQLLDRLGDLAHHLHQHAPGLFPRSGGVWHWTTPDGEERHLLVEEFIPGLSVERLKFACEQKWSDGNLNDADYDQQRTGLDRLAVSTFMRLWEALGRRTFTSDPSPWNLLVAPTEDEPSTSQTATIIDLHSLEEDIDLAYVIQRLAAVYGLRQDVIEASLLPGVFDALGTKEGRHLLQTALPQLEAQAAQATKNLGVDLQRPLLNAIYALG